MCFRHTDMKYKCYHKTSGLTQHLCNVFNGQLYSNVFSSIWSVWIKLESCKSDSSCWSLNMFSPEFSRSISRNACSGNSYMSVVVCNHQNVHWCIYYLGREQKRLNVHQQESGKINYGSSILGNAPHDIRMSGILCLKNQVDHCLSIVNRGIHTLYT